ncbi:phospholipid scramblase-related protein [Myxococcaceae bacterium GXIMD 01537]
MSHGPKSEPELELDWGGRTPRAEAEAAAAAAKPFDEQWGEAGKGMPGDPKYMSMELRHALQGLLEGPGLKVQQHKEWGEILLGWETRNRYIACDATGRPVFYVGETGEGWQASLLRNFWPFYPVRLECMTLAGSLALTVERPWSFFFARAEVTAWDGRPMGRIQQRWRFVGRQLDILGPTGLVLATIEGPYFRPWTFHVKQKGEVVATIRKKWAGLTQEYFTNADNFGVEFTESCTDPRLRQLILAATLLVDFTYFEQKGRGRGGHRGLLPGILD